MLYRIVVVFKQGIKTELHVGLKFINFIGWAQLAVLGIHAVVGVGNVGVAWSVLS